MDLGKIKLELKRMQARATISPENTNKSTYYESPELKLILAAQRREELQQEGDKLDEMIIKKENEIQTMRQTLTQLNALNSMSRKAAKASRITT
jgi:hypothetical protein